MNVFAQLFATSTLDLEMVALSFLSSRHSALLGSSTRQSE